MKKAGFTLLEILIVLGILAGMTVLGLGKFRRQDGNIKSVARKLVVLVKEIRNKSRLTHSTYRLVLHMEPTKGLYWVEKSNGNYVVDPAALYEKKDKSAEEPKTPQFQVDTSFFKKEQELPSGLYFASVEFMGQAGLRTEGDAYIHFFPEGLVEVSSIQVTNRKELTWTFLINPITGQTDIVKKAQSLQDLSR